MRYTGPKSRLCRREGMNLFGSQKYQKVLQRKPNIPGAHGSSRMGKLTEYAKQLREKQKAKRAYGLSEKQFSRCFDEASRNKGVTGEVLFQILERRLDNALYRAGFALTRFQSRQFASHGLFLLNGRRVDVPSIQLRVGDIVEIRPKSAKSPVFQNNLDELKDYSAPSWLNVDPKKLRFEVAELPGPHHFDAFVDSQLIVEFYSR